MNSFSTQSRPGGYIHKTISVPGDKSISHRAVMFSALADGTSEINGFLASGDCLSTIECFRKLGIKIARDGEYVRVEGKGLNGFIAPADILDVGNSGTTLRLITGILAGQNFNTHLTGDTSIQRRPMERVFAPLRQMGAKFSNDLNQMPKTAPFTIFGSDLTGVAYTLPVASAQVKSAILLASLYAEGKTVIVEPQPTRDHTEIMLNNFGANIVKIGNRIISHPVKKLTAQNITIPSDISSAAFFLAAGLIIPNSELTVTNVGINPTRTGIIDAFRAMGARLIYSNERIEAGEPVADITVCSSELSPITLEGDIIPRMIDEIPVFAVTAACAKGRSVIKDAAELKYKESDRISVMSKELRKLGASILETDDGMIIDGRVTLRGTTLQSHGDHRVAMSLTVASAIAEGVSVIEDTDCVNISFPTFFDIWKKIF
ncbi:MAG: 3-phosphoshikimate 1-carboxyvinyltransferase [Clostridiales bacterium]|nr:3-phosphoshikimate 1-carboxyvinyltransferase [Clostridiales bacterium]